VSGANGPENLRAAPDSFNYKSKNLNKITAAVWRGGFRVPPNVAATQNRDANAHAARLMRIKLAVRD
jgi:hypothetical protein